MQKINQIQLSDFVKNKIKEKALSLFNQLKLEKNTIKPKNKDSQLTQLDIIKILREKYLQINKKQIKVRKKKVVPKNRRMKTYRSYTASFKQKTIKDIKALVDKYKLPLSKVISFQCKKLNIASKNIYRWFKMQTFQDRKYLNRNAKFPDMEELLVQFIKMNPSAKRKQITQKAKQITKILHPQQLNSFSFSQGWFQKFKRRHSQILLNIQKSDLKKMKNGSNHSMQSQMDQQSDYHFIQCDQMQVQFIGDDNQLDHSEDKINSQQDNCEQKYQQLKDKRPWCSINDESSEFQNIEAIQLQCKQQQDSIYGYRCL